MKVKHLLGGILIIALIGGLAFLLKDGLPARTGDNAQKVPRYLFSIGQSGGEGKLTRPTMAVQGAGGKVFVTDTGSRSIKIFDRKGKYIKSIGSSRSGPVRLDVPYGIAVLKNGNILISDLGSLTVREFDPDTGQPVKTWIDQNAGIKPAFIHAGKDTVLISDVNNHVILKFDRKGEQIGALGEGDLYFPQGIAVDKKGLVWVADSAHAKVRAFDKKGKAVISVDGSDHQSGKFGMVKGLTVDGLDRVLVVGTTDNSIRALDRQGRELFRFGKAGSGRGEFSFPLGISAGEDFLLIVDRGNNRVQFWQY